MTRPLFCLPFCAAVAWLHDFPVSAIIIDSQLVDVADQHELNTGERSEGVIFSVRSFGIKATSGVGGLLGGFGLEFIGFPKTLKSAGWPRKR